MANFETKKVLITGVAGFIGSNLADRLLEEGYAVVGIDNLQYGLKEQVDPRVEFHRLDIRDKAMYPLFEGVDTVFHMAAKNCISDCERDPVETASVNVVGTVNVLEASRLARVRKVIYAESSSVYEGTDIFPTSEEVRESPVSFYADSKLAARAFAQSCIRTYSMNVTALRYFNVYGPRQDFRRTDRPIMTEFIVQLLTGQRPVLYGAGARSKDYIYIDDVNDFHVLAMRDDRTAGQTYNIGSGGFLTFKQVLDAVQAVLGTNVDPELRPALSGGVLKTHADISKASGLGWAPKTRLEDGLRASVAYIKDFVLPALGRKMV